jgi:hypothetical protein
VGSTCESCGKKARVQILAGYHAGTPVVRFLCLRCAQHIDEVGVEDQGVLTRERLSVGAMLLLGGICIGALGLPGEHLGIGSSVGFGVAQKVLAAGGALLVIVGALLRADVIAVVGTVVFGLGVFADLIGWVESSQVGAWRGIALGLSLTLIVGGMALRRRFA